MPISNFTNLNDFKAMRDTVSSSSQPEIKYRDSTEDDYSPIVYPRKEKALLKKEIKRYRDEASRRHLDEAFYRLAEACDPDLEIPERSNRFDEWKDILDILARESVYMSIKHHKVLGSLIAATHQRDLSDFEFYSLKVFIEAMNVLRQPRITKQESKRAIDTLLNYGMEVSIPLAVDNLSEDREEKLENMMAEIVEKSRDQT